MNRLLLPPETLCGISWQTKRVSERKISIVASVTMNAGIFALPTSTPLIRPHSAPIAMAASSVKTMLLVVLNTITAKPPTNASIEPTDRSICPVMTTSPMPSAMMPTTAECLRMFITPTQVRLALTR